MSNIFLKASHVCRARRKKLLASTALLAVATQPVAASASDVIIFNYSSYSGTQTNLANAQTTAGNTATIASPGTTVDLSGYAQVWDLGFSTALTQAQITYYTNYLQNGGTLFLMGENAGFQARDSSITSLINALGGGTATVSTNSNSSNSQTVASQFLLANQTSAVSFAAIGKFTSLGTGTCITSDCGAAAWGVGSLSGAPTGTIISVLDVNFLDNNYYQSAFVQNLIAYLAQQQQAGQNPPPALGNITTTDGSGVASQVGTSLAARFDGGELTADQGSSSNFSVTSNGGILNANGGRYVFSGVFSDDSGTPSGLLIVDRVGGGAIVLTGINTFSGGIGVQAGAHLSIANGASLGTGLLQLIGTSLTPAYFEITGTTTIANNITVAGDPVFDVAGGSTATVSGSINDGATPGDVVKQGDGTLVLSGVNGYTGGTVLSAGTLALSGNGTLGATSGTTTVSGGTLDLGGTAQTQDGGVSLTGGTITNGTLSSAGTFDMQAGSVDAVLTGAGSLVKSGEGTVTLSGANSYTGGTTISGGTLALSGNGTLGATSGTTTVSGGTLDLGGTTQTQDGGVSLTGGTITNGTLSSAGTFDMQAGSVDAVLTGAGSLVKSGEGTVTLSGTNSYTGGTTISGGTLALSGNGSIATTAVTNDGTLDISGLTNGGASLLNLNGSGAVTLGDNSLTVTSGSGTFSGAITGAGGFTLAGGTLALSGTNAYSGTTTIAEGAALAGTVASLSGSSILDDGTLLVNQSTAATLAQAISGSGMLIKTGTATLTLTGANSYSGGTLVSAGTLKGDTGSIQGAVEDDATVEFAQASNGTYAGALTGTGALVKSGTGALTLTGTSSLSGATQVSAGKLVVNGTLGTSLLTLASGTTLGGSGAIVGNVSALSGATVAPGNSPGTLTVNGAMTMASGSTLSLDIDGRTYSAAGGSGSYDRLVVSGAFTAAGTLAPVLRGITGSATNSFTPVLGDRFTVVTAGSVSGQFASITQPTSGLGANTRFDALYGTSTVQLVVTPGSFAVLGAANGWNRDSMAAAVALDGVRNVAANQGLFSNLYGFDAGGYRTAFAQMSGQIYAHAMQNFADVASGTLGVVRNSAVMGGNVSGRSSGGMELWGSYLNISQAPRDSALANGYNAHNEGFVAGLTLLNHDHVRFGIAGSYSRNKVSTQIGSTARGQSGSAYGYGYWAPTSRFDLTIVAGFTSGGINTSRATTTTSGDVQASSSGNAFAAQLAADARFKLAGRGGTALYAVAGLEGNAIDVDHLVETATNSAFALNLPHASWQTLQSRLGGQFVQKLPFGAFTAYANWTRQLADLPTASRTVALAGASWNVQSIGTSRSGASFGGALSARLTKALAVSLQYDRAQAGVGQHSDRASAGLSLAF